MRPAPSSSEADFFTALFGARPSEERYAAGTRPSKRSAAHNPPKNRSPGAWDNAAEDGWYVPWPRLLTNAGVLGTCKQYIRTVRNFPKFQKTNTIMQREVPIMKTDGDLDRAMLLWMEKRCYGDRRAHHDGKNVRSGVLHPAPEVHGQLPLASRGAKTWEKLEGNVEREPLCRAYQGLTIEALARKKRVYGWAGFSQCDAQLREQDVSQLRARDISCSSTEVSLELGVLTRGESTKAGTSQGVDILHPLLKEFSRHMKATLDPDDLVFPFQMNKYNQATQESCEEYRLEELGATAHLFRHSATVFLLHDLGWPEAKTRDRVRWGHEKSMAHYRKKHLLIRNASRLRPEEEQRGAWLWEAPHTRLGLVDFDLPAGFQCSDDDLPRGAHVIVPSQTRKGEEEEEETEEKETPVATKEVRHVHFEEEEEETEEKEEEKKKKKLIRPSRDAEQGTSAYPVSLSPERA